ncbi:MAG: glutamine-hydrolyzing GMP synthase [Oscillospiraceae bacterium]|jgi:GMP synthase (glutamine-hydrolysing)
MEKIIVLDFGGQYSHLIARRVRELGVYCEVLPHSVKPERLVSENPKGLILTGGPNSVYDPESLTCDPAVLSLGIPVLGICYGAQLIAGLEGGTVLTAPKGEYGRVELTAGESVLYKKVPRKSTVWMSHMDYIAKTPEGYKVTGSTSTCPAASMENTEKGVYAVQYHPEVEHTEFGKEVINSFLYDVCKCSGGWEMHGYVEHTVKELREKLGGKKVLCALSGGVDSTVSAVMVHKAVGDALTCIFVDHGLLRKNEGDDVERICRGKFKMNFIRVDASERFLRKLAGVTEPEKKRRIIGEEFIRVFEAEAKKLGKVDYLVQGTIYPDVIESGTGNSAVIKSHHNVGGLPDAIDFEEVIEPLRMLFKDEVRMAGLELGIPPEIVWRQPFPGPGLAVRVIGEITKEKLDILREADAIFREEVGRAGLSRSISQYFAILTNVQSVGVMGDFRTYEYTIGLRAVTTTDFMTADFARVPYEVLERTSSRIVNEVRHVNRVIYDITPKPPATIEWE